MYALLPLIMCKSGTVIRGPFNKLQCNASTTETTASALIMCTTYRVVHKTSPTKMAASQIRLFVRNCPWLQVFNWPLFCLSKSGKFSCVTRYGMIWSATSQMFTFSAYLPNTKLFSVAYCGADLPKIIMPPPVGGIKNAAIRPSVCPTLVGVGWSRV